MIKFQLLATEWVIQTKLVQGSQGEWISINGWATGVPTVTVPGLDQSTEEYARSPATQGRNHSLLNSPEQDKPRGWRDQPPTKPNIKGHLDRGKSCPAWA